MDRISLVLPKVLHRRGIEKHASSALTVHRAKNWLTEKLPHLSEFVSVAKVQDGTLFIHCSHSVAMQECQCAVTDMLQFLRAECPFSGIKDIRIVRD
jgi:hypothetical protein